jgi:hypothetical protein
MSHDVLTNALRAEGLDDKAIARVDAALAAEHLSVTMHWLTRERLDREKATEERAASRALGLAAAVPYVGKINDCQATVWDHGRGGTAHRCQKLAKFVVRRKSDFSGHRDRPPDRPFDERLAVCRTHAADIKSYRYHGHWSYEKCADEMVEPEYQP